MGFFEINVVLREYMSYQ